jgi:aminoglycoside phosphotransferase
MSKSSDVFVAKWISANVHNIPGLEDYSGHVKELAQQMTADAADKDIDEDELNETVGDAEDYLTNAYEKVQDSTVGFHEADDA